MVKSYILNYLLHNINCHEVAIIYNFCFAFIGIL
jgi:hypothetical protein